MPKLPDVYIRHILDEITFLERFREIPDGATLKRDEVLSRAVVRSLEIIGEAATNVDEGFRAQHPEVPWRRMVAMRNRLIHGYMGVNFNIVVNVLRNEIPVLRIGLEQIIVDLD
jgi:uncharacterized protein with HEPN domain